jgi:hypothetical protein
MILSKFEEIRFICERKDDDKEIVKLDLKTAIIQILDENEELKEKVERYEKVIHNIANIDTLFMNPDGTERDWNDKEALREIENLVKPIWDKHCEKSWEKHRQKAKETKDEQSLRGGK